MKPDRIDDFRAVATGYFLNEAIRIGDHLVQTAMRMDGSLHRNWLGRRDIEDPEIARYSHRTVALSPEVYSGSAGIALFLSQLHAATGRSEYAQAAVGSWLRSCHYVKTNPFPASPISLYAGDLGLIHVGSMLLDNDPTVADLVLREIAEIEQRLWDGLSIPHSLDLIGGNAGAIPALLHLEHRFENSAYGALARRCAQEIVEKSQWHGEMCFWTSEKIHGVELQHPPLTGFSHGATGLAVGLLEAFRAFGEEVFLRHARGAFAFEDSFFNPDVGNWIDTRQPHAKKDGKIIGTFRNAWCHGAPGIGLGHRRAAELDPEQADEHQAFAQVAAKTTLAVLQTKSKAANVDVTLCHGSLGLSDIILEHGWRKRDPALIAAARAASLNVLGSQFSVKAMPSGLQAGGYSPCLMVGLAGVGLHCLRLEDESIASILLPTSESRQDRGARFS
ncbi:lanthionine synthetase LanC family protein [Rhizobium panacihumi]|uniref:lanthionine synthetase LanC family protein n=1 Tax=Rhizobium panacihumi TaxID=2008450 RepID=UPI003D79D5F5